MLIRGMSWATVSVTCVSSTFFCVSVTICTHAIPCLITQPCRTLRPKVVSSTRYKFAPRYLQSQLSPDPYTISRHTLISTWTFLATSIISWFGDHQRSLNQGDRSWYASIVVSSRIANEQYMKHVRILLIIRHEIPDRTRAFYWACYLQGYSEYQARNYAILISFSSFTCICYLIIWFFYRQHNRPTHSGISKRRQKTRSISCSKPDVLADAWGINPPFTFIVIDIDTQNASSASWEPMKTWSGLVGLVKSVIFLAFDLAKVWYSSIWLQYWWCDLYHIS